MKKILAILLASITLFSLAFPTQAALPDSSASPRYNYIETYDVDLTINKTTGIASCSASCFVYGNNTVRIEYQLQRYMGSYWATVKTWTSSGTSSTSLRKTWAVTSGYTYCGEAIYRVYDSSGNLLETDSKSKTYYYPST